MSFSRPLVPARDVLSAVISLQSHVSYGHVGNAVATFVMQRLGCAVTPLHTVMYSSHLGYEGWRGEPTSPDATRALIQGLDAVGALKRQHGLLMGFLGSAAHGEVGLELIEALPDSDTLCVVDPVMGDHGQLYVDESLVDFYREAMLGHADVLTPNAFELGVLTRMPVHDVSSARRALFALAQNHNARRAPHQSPCLCVVKGVVDDRSPEHISVVAMCGEAELVLKAPRLPRQFTGAGDLFSALCMAKLVQGSSPHDALSHATQATSAVLEVTMQHDSKELELIRAQGALVDTTIKGA